MSFFVTKRACDRQTDGEKNYHPQDGIGIGSWRGNKMAVLLLFVAGV